MDAKKKNMLIKLAAVVLIVGGLFGFIAIKVYNYKKNKQQEVELSKDPESWESNKEFDDAGEAQRNELAKMMFTRDSVKKDTVRRDTAVAPVERKKRKVAKPAPSGSVISLAIEAKEEVRVERKPVIRRVEEPREKPTVKFNFVIVEDEDKARSVMPDPAAARESGKLAAKDQVNLFAGKIYGYQKVKANEPVTIRSTESFVCTSPRKFNAPAGSIFYGTCNLSSNRLTINLTSCVTQEGSFPCNIEVYDNDYIKGIFIKEGIETGIEESPDMVVEDAANVIPNQLAGAVIKNTSRKVQRSLNRQNRIEVPLHDGQDVFLGVTEPNTGKGGRTSSFR